MKSILMTKAVGIVAVVALSAGMYGGHKLTSWRVNQCQANHNKFIVELEREQLATLHEIDKKNEEVLTSLKKQKQRIRIEEKEIVKYVESKEKSECSDVIIDGGLVDRLRNRAASDQD